MISWQCTRPGKMIRYGSGTRWYSQISLGAASTIIGGVLKHHLTASIVGGEVKSCGIGHAEVAATGVPGEAGRVQAYIHTRHSERGLRGLSRRIRRRDSRGR